MQIIEAMRQAHGLGADARASFDVCYCLDQPPNRHQSIIVTSQLNSAFSIFDWKARKGPQWKMRSAASLMRFQD